MDHFRLLLAFYWRQWKWTTDAGELESDQRKKPCGKINILLCVSYSKSVLHLWKCMFHVHIRRCSTDSNGQFYDRNWYIGWYFDWSYNLIDNSPTSSGSLGENSNIGSTTLEYQNFDWQSNCPFCDLLRDYVRQFSDLSCKTDRLFSYMFCNSDCQFSDWKSVALVHVQVTGAASWQLVHHVFNNNIWEVR